MPTFEDSSDYLIQEFEAMDADGDGLLTGQEVFEILIYYGVVLSENEMQKQLRQVSPSINMSQFEIFMKSLNDSNRKVRELFASFTKEDDWSADKTDIQNGLEKLGCKNVKKLVTSMEANGNRITYKNFLKVYFKGKGTEL